VKRFSPSWFRTNLRAASLAVRTKATWRRRAGSARPHSLPAPLIVSLTSYPPRFPTLGLTLRCLLSQTIKADSTILWVGFDSVKALPEDVVALARDGLEIRASADIGPYQKLVPALESHPDAFIVTADDDVYYGPRWLEDLVKATGGERRHEVLCHRPHRVAVGDDGRPLPYGRWTHEIAESAASPPVFPTGVGGVLYPPGTLPPETLDVRTFRRLCPNDDLWFYWCGRRNGSVSRKIGPRRPLTAWIGSQKVALYAKNVVANDLAIDALVTHFGFPPRGRDRVNA